MTASRLPRSLVVRLDSAGDVLLAGPAVRAVAAGSSYTALLCGPQGAEAGRLLPTSTTSSCTTPPGWGSNRRPSRTRRPSSC